MEVYVVHSLVAIMEFLFNPKDAYSYLAIIEFALNLPFDINILILYWCLSKYGQVQLLYKRTRHILLKGTVRSDDEIAGGDWELIMVDSKSARMKNFALDAKLPLNSCLMSAFFWKLLNSPVSCFPWNFEIDVLHQLRLRSSNKMFLLLISVVL